MSTRVVFLEDGKPQGGVRVKKAASDRSEQISNDAGQLSLDLEEGRQEIVVYYNGSWVPHVVSVEREASMLLVDMGDMSGERQDAAKSKPDANFLDVGRLDLGDRYVFERMLGRGGMGMVIRARDRLLNRSVAVKLLSEELRESPEAQKIFLSEARHLATLSHPNLVSVHDISKIEERTFMVIEYIKGETVERLIKSLKRLSESVTLKLAIQFTRVVAYLHDHGIIHRDIKPANAIVRHDGTLKLIDFGLARHFDELYIRGTRVRGTPAYMSPEQITGADLSTGSDIYQLGVCFYEMLTGKLPFKGDMSYAHVHSPPPRVSEVIPGITPALDDLILECMAKDPADRPKNAHELLNRLQAIHRLRDSVNGAPALTPDQARQHSPQGSHDSLSNVRLKTAEMQAMNMNPNHTDGGLIHPTNGNIVSPEVVSQHNLVSQHQLMSSMEMIAAKQRTPPIVYVALVCSVVIALGALWVAMNNANPSPAPGNAPEPSALAVTANTTDEAPSPTPPNEPAEPEATPTEIEPAAVGEAAPVEPTKEGASEEEEGAVEEADDEPAEVAAPAATAPRKATPKPRVIKKAAAAPRPTPEATPEPEPEAAPEPKKKAKKKPAEKKASTKGLFEKSSVTESGDEDTKLRKGFLPMK
jgi:serine/threonine-protein kinase